MGYHNQGIAQGGIVNTPEGEWFAILFQDSGAVGRIPVLIPVHFKNGFPVFGTPGKLPDTRTKKNKENYFYEPLFTSDFVDNNGRLKLQRQWNHLPDRPNKLYYYHKQVIHKFYTSCEYINAASDVSLYRSDGYS